MMKHVQRILHRKSFSNSLELPINISKQVSEKEHTPDSLWHIAWRKFRRHKLAFFSLLLLILIVFSVIVGPELLPYDPNRINLKEKNQPPTLAHPMGTDELGRDLLVRVLVGGRLSLSVALVCVIVSMTVGVTVGATAGYAVGKVDNLLMRLTDIFYSIPSLFVAILLMTIVGPSFWTIVVAIAALSWMTAARLVRGSFLSLNEREFVTAARAIGAKGIRIVRRHLLPNALSPVIVTATLAFAEAILVESALSFLGFGFQPPQASWGRMLYESQEAVIRKGYFWMGFFPGLMIFLVVLSVNFIGDGLRDALDPTTRRV